MKNCNKPKENDNALPLRRSKLLGPDRKNGHDDENMKRKHGENRAKTWIYWSGGSKRPWEKGGGDKIVGVMVKWVSGGDHNRLTRYHILEVKC